jgi:mono/diheme cytochrome c family protein
MRRVLRLTAACALGSAAWCAPDAAREFTETIRPVLVENCAACHNPGNPKPPSAFLKGTDAGALEANRGLWRSVAAQLRNRTMPPAAAASKLAEGDRLRVASWIDSRLRETACSTGEYAGPAITRRLNRREYHNTIRDLLGVDFEVSGILPADGTGGAGFDTNGETLFVPPIATERYLEAAQQILDRVIVSPPVAITQAADPANPGAAVSMNVPIYTEGSYDAQVDFEAGETPPEAVLKVDGVDVGSMAMQQRRVDRRASPRSTIGRLQVTLARGTHVISVTPVQSVKAFTSFSITQRAAPPAAEKRALHYRLFGMEPGERPLDPRKAARQILETLLPKAFRRPVAPGDVERFLALYDRAAERGDPYEERVKLALKAVLVWPEFLFRIERKREEPGIHPLGGYELATRLSYFLWSTAPDDTLVRLAGEGRLGDAKVLALQVERMLDDPRSRAFVTSFVGQWLGTQDIGGRVMPLLTEIQSYYTPEIAADLKAQPVLLFDRILGENRSVVELLDANYTHLTRRLAKFYQIEDRVSGLSDSEFRLVDWPDDRRAGILGLSGVLGMTSRYQETSPVLRGAWALETLIGTPVPPPPPDVPQLTASGEGGRKLGMREQLDRHRADAACAACHNLMDPIGLGLENFDWMGRWRDKEANGKPVDARGSLPSGEAFNGPVELRRALAGRKDEFVRNLTLRLLGYALGRSPRDGDSCTVERLVDTVRKDGYRARTLIRETALSVPFRSMQGGAGEREPAIEQRSLNISAINAEKQDAASHLNQVKPQALTRKK